MKFLAILEPVAGKTSTDFAPFAVAEGIAVWNAYRVGQLREMYLQPEPLVVTLVIEAFDSADVHSTLATLPFVAQHLLDARVVTLGPWLPWEKMFAPELMKGAPP